MLSIIIPEREFFDEATNSFITFKSKELHFEHSLVSISKWESKWCKPFLETNNKTHKETIDYIRCMTLNDDISLDIYKNLPDIVFDQLTTYINEKMTATWINDKKESNVKKEIHTSEIIYYWMFVHNIPMECQYWHLNRLLTLIRVCNLKSQPQKKMSKKEMLAERKAQNEARRAKYNSKG